MAQSAEREPRPDTRWLAYGDGLRIVGAVAVVLVHVSSQGVAELGRIGRWDWWACLGVNAACRWAVPIFVMLSGALLLDPARDEPLGRFFRRRVTRVGVPLVFWTAFYLGWRVWYRGEEPSLAWAVRAVAFGAPYAHLYFLYLLLGLYLVTPVLRAFLREASQARQAAVVLGAFLIGAGDKVIRSHFDLGVTAFLLFVPYLGYYLAGWWLRDLRLSPQAVRRAWAVLLGSIVLTALATRGLFSLFRSPGHRYYALEYLSPTVIAMSLAAFVVMAHHFRELPRRPALRWLADSMLGIYLIHPALLNVFRDHGLTPTWHGAWVGLPVSAVLALTISLALTALLRVLPGGRWVVGG